MSSSQVIESKSSFSIDSMQTKNVLVVFVFALSVFSSKPVQGQEIVNLNEEVTVKTTDQALAEKLATKEVIARVTHRFITDLLGAEKAESMKTAITNRLLPEYGRYIPILTAGRPTFQGENAIVFVQLRFSPESLKSLMISEGLISLSDQPVNLLPLISVSDASDGSVFQWWATTSGDDAIAPQGSASHIASKILGRMFELSHKTGVFLIEPVRFKLQGHVPQLLKDPRLTDENAKTLAQLMRAHLFMIGQIAWEKPDENTVRLDIDVRVQHAATGRLLADVRSSKESPASQVLKDSAGMNQFLTESLDPLIQDLHSQFRKGSLNTSLIRLVFEGDHIPSDLEKIRNNVPKTLRSIRSIRERKFTRGAIAFEAESDKAAMDLKGDWEKNPRVEGLKLRLISANGDELRFRIN